MVVNTQIISFRNPFYKHKAANLSFPRVSSNHALTSHTYVEEKAFYLTLLHFELNIIDFQNIY